jgi:hypothetical protein
MLLVLLMILANWAFNYPTIYHQGSAELLSKGMIQQDVHQHQATKIRKTPKLWSKLGLRERNQELINSKSWLKVSISNLKTHNSSLSPRSSWRKIRSKIRFTGSLRELYCSKTLISLELLRKKNSRTMTLYLIQCLRLSLKPFYPMIYHRLGKLLLLLQLSIKSKWCLSMFSVWDKKLTPNMLKKRNKSRKISKIQW